VNNDLSLLKISGLDAGKFLQGQLTCDVSALADRQFILSAHCNPQGRVVSLFYLIFLDNAYYLLMPADMLAITQAALKKYAVFFKTTLEDASNELENVLAQICKPALFDIQAGVPRIHPETSGAFLPHDINLDQLGAISFEKGCYTGQEIIARMQYRGKLKKRMRTATLTTDNPPTPGSDDSLGTIVDVASQNNHCTILYIAPIAEAE
jgi:folate-binding protein YgfZ